jgi:phage terminase large subunit-like protein
VLGSTTPREWTRPLVEGPPGPCGCGCALTPATSLGFAFETFCSGIVHKPLDPWQRWLSIHGLELLPDGRPRFRQILVLVARQNGKTELLVLLTLFWLYVLGVGMVLGTSTKLDYARESWLKAVRLARSVPDLRAEIESVRQANGEQEISTVGGSRYKIAASNEEGGRSLTVHRLVEDELRQHRDWSAHEAAENAMNAVPDAQAWAISNEGDDRAVVLTALKNQALAFIETGVGDPRLGYFGWTAPDGCTPDDIAALAAANPNLGRRIDAEALLGKAVRAREAGGEQEAKFRTEVLCQRVKTLVRRVIDPAAWARCADPASAPGEGVVFAVDMSPAGAACAIAVAGRRPDGRRTSASSTTGPAPTGFRTVWRSWSPRTTP